MTEQRRLIEVAFPLEQTSLDSVHEKNVRHGHISTLHIWPARRPLAACRAALIATLLPDPGTPEERKRLLEKIGGKVVEKLEKKKVGGRTVEILRKETIGGVLHWGRESSPDMEWFRHEIREAYGGRAPRVLDPFAGGGAIPLEAMRLGCEATAIDINPVAWFILKCTLEYPQRLAGQHRPLPKFAVESAKFMEAFLKGTGKLTKKQLERNLDAVQQRLFPPPDVDLAWHVRAWGFWVLQKAKADLERFYPIVDGKPTVAYLWARTVACKNCRAIVPLLKTCWLCKRDNKRVLLKVKPTADRTGVVFSIDEDVAVVGGNAAQRREHDKRMGQGTMSRNGAWCPCCGQPGTVAMEMEDIRQEGQAGRLGAIMTAVVVETEDGKEYRLPTEGEVRLAAEAGTEVERVFAELPFGVPTESLAGKDAPGFRVPLYGFTRWNQLFTPRQLLALATFVRHTRRVREALADDGYSGEWAEAASAYLALMISRLLSYSSAQCCWHVSGEKMQPTFLRFAFPIVWDIAEVNPLSELTGGYTSAFDWIYLAVRHLLKAVDGSPTPRTAAASAISVEGLASMDLVLTDPPYYDAIAYSDLMDFYYVWLRRTLVGLSPEIDTVFREQLAPKWDHGKADGELIDDASRHGGNAQQSKRVYENGMAHAFENSHRGLRPEGRLVIVFAHKHPDAWEALVSAIIRAGFVVDGSWPIQTEMGTRMRAHGSAALSSSVWLVCKKRPEAARPGWDNQVLEVMHANIYTRLREYWDAGIRGPDFVWAATGPALEAYSKHPVVKKANDPGKLMEVSEFLRAVRRIVVDFVVGRVLSRTAEEASVTGLDDVTTYYLLHRHDFGLDDAPIGPCILYAVSCGLSDSDLADEFEILARTGGAADGGEDEEEEAGAEDADAEAPEGTGSKVKLRAWNQRKRKTMGYDAEGRPAPLIDQIHRLMHLWRAGDQAKVDEYLQSHALAGNRLFHRVLQALIELSPPASEERALLETISNHVEAFDLHERQMPGWNIEREGAS
jgi:putative DNA methylase